MSKCVFAGCFDPFTNGHLDVVKRLSDIFEGVYVVVSKNAEKSLVLDGEMRYELVKRSIDIPNVQVALHEGLLVDFCKANDVDCIVKGVRNLADFDYERLQSDVNKKLGGIETLFLPCSDEMGFVSSSFVRQMLALGKDVSQYLPKQTADEVAALYSKK